ncbi:hypothetical protein O6H91_23G029300 [Diphasiastrum complanatum]|uniref:Uncharacterized protein n=1 Tax=Diphasiastrum complanatum TaxID=34168 RepID=A0ACC2A9D6_DIPCM|nr:hypothetical protein O6H91_Y371100 [Diphasiastrum complanatum]KAJ7514130.1 hypothetical protein O6H91_23G029300 [Diphasiastrum complanatum]
MADLSTAIIALKSPDANDRSREYRKGNWTLHETMVLIAAKKQDDERRLKGCDKLEKGRSGEFRWKWVENYCWKNGCERSQNQCNDKWDNLLRDYKKVRDYELTSVDQQGQQQRSYWQLEKQERKTRGLPSNLLIEVYDALREIVDKKVPARTLPISAAPTSDKPRSSQPPPAPPSIPLPAEAEVSKTSTSEGSDIPESQAKKRRVSSTADDLVSAMTKGLSELSQALLACEEMRDKRHKDLLGVEERKLLLEQSKTEIHRQGVEGLIGAVNNLSSAILTLVADRK